MRIDENNNIEVECQEDYDKGIINDYCFTCKPDQLIYTKDLMHCVGLALINEVNRIRKRGLMHVHYNKEFIRGEDGNIILPDDKIKLTNECLENFVNDFEKNEKGKKIFKNPRAIMVYVRSLPIGKIVENIVLRNEFTGEIHEVETKDINRYENPMADYIKDWLKKKKIDLYGSNATSNKILPSVLNMVDNPKEINHKEFALAHDNLRIGMYNKANTLLNLKDYKTGLYF